MPKIKLDRDTAYDYNFSVDPKGSYDVPADTLKRWEAAQEAWTKAQDEMAEFDAIVAEQAKVRENAKQALKDERHAAMVNEAFENVP